MGGLFKKRNASQESGRGRGRGRRKREMSGMAFCGRFIAYEKRTLEK